jgi:RimJ/RimL family protein N-acetyltransferase
VASISDLRNQLALLRRDPLKHAVILKYLLATPGATLHQIVRGRANASLLLVDPARLSYDRENYPEAASSVMIASDDPALTHELLEHVPRDRRAIFRLASEADRAVVSRRFTLERRAAFLSFTGTGEAATSAEAIVAADAASAAYDLYAGQGHAAAWLAPLLQGGRAFTATVHEASIPVAACFAFELDTAIWEVGGVYCRPEHRGRGHARRAVRAALAELARRKLISRYQVEEANIASIRLATALGMTRFLTLTHFVSRQPSP